MGMFCGKKAALKDEDSVLTMNLITKRICANVCAAVMGITAVGVCGELLLDNKSVGAQKAPAVQVKNVETQSVKTTAATEVYDFVKFKKSSVDKYDMTYAQQKTQGKISKKKSSASEFTVEMPEDNGEYYNTMNDPANFTDTRSIADEYYTVYDIISGGTVTLNGHELLCRIVNSEIGDNWGEEAIKAQAVAAYTWVRFNDSLGAIPTVGLKSGYSSKIENCVNKVEGQAVMYNGNIINAVYSASTAGYSTTSQDIWGVSYPYLQRVKSEFDNKDPNWGIETTYTKEEVKERIESQTDIKLSDDVQNWFKIDSAFSGKYISGVTIDGHTSCTYEGSSGRITGITLCNLFDVKSNAMEISYKDGVFTFKSYGWGHGVGMSQWGACYYAEAGYKYDQILTHYYVNCYLGLSSVNDKAVKRGQMSQEEIDKEIKDSEIVDEGGNAVAADKDKDKDSEPAQTQPTESESTTTTTTTTAATTAPVSEEPSETTTSETTAQPVENSEAEQSADEISN